MSNESGNAPALTVRHRLIVRNRRGDALLMRVESGRPQLPSFTSDDRHTAEVDYINDAMATRFGVATTVLRSLSHSEPVAGAVDRAHELELRDGALPAGLRWVDADAVSFDDAADRAALSQWRPETNVIDGREWTQCGWFDEASAWIDRTLLDSGLGAAQEIRQLRNWASSSVLWAKTSAAEFYFKALPRSGRIEAELAQYLAREFAAITPRLVAAQSERRWLLMAACAGRKLEEIDDVASWECAAARYGRLQVDCIARVAELTALGCPTRSLDSLAQRIESLVSDAAALRPGETDGLTHAEYRRLRAAVPELQRRCEELAACGVPLTLEHGDFWPGNVFVDTTSCAVIDWEDAAIAHPFFSLAPLTVGLMNAGLGEHGIIDRIETAYLSAFDSIAEPTPLRRALHLAAPLCFIQMATRYRNQRASIVRQHPWMRDLVPQALRLALARMQ